MNIAVLKYLVFIIQSLLDKENYKELIGELVDKFKREFPNYKKNPYISKMDKRRKIVFHLLNLKMYNLIYILFAIAS